jgi:hypothetical protein
MPVQMVVQHRGGEIDDTDTGVETFMNGALGLGVVWNVNQGKLRRLSWEMDALGYYQQAGKLWPFDRGWGWYTKVGADFKHLFVQAGAFGCNQFISLLGSPYMGAVSTRHEGGYYEGNPFTGFVTVEYSRTYAKLYSFGLKGDIYYSKPGNLTHSDESARKEKTQGTGISLGAYFRLNLSFLLKSYKR